MPDAASRQRGVDRFGARDCRLDEVAFRSQMLPGLALAPSGKYRLTISVCSRQNQLLKNMIWNMSL
jgi:hypothetical protein